MSYFQSILLGIVQGLTEFLPISSSAHLVLFPYLLGWQIPAGEAFVFDVLVQVATLVAVIVFFWRVLVDMAVAFVKGIWKRQPFADPLARQAWLILLATIPAGLAGLLLKGLVEEAFSSPAAVGFFMLITAGLLVIAERFGKRSRELEQINWKDSLFIGVFQAIAIFPGISRSGSTITGGMLRNLQRPPAARFAFLMSIPIMLAAGLLASLDMAKVPNISQQLPVFLAGFIAAGITGYLVIRWLLRYLINHTLYIFSIYCAIVGLLTLATTLLIR